MQNKFVNASIGRHLMWFLCLLFALTEAAVKRPSKNSHLVTPQKRQNGVCANHLPNEFVEHPENCRLFYLCMENNQAVVAPCPPMMLFNPESKLCDKPENVQCRASGASSSTESVTATTVATPILTTVSTPPIVAGNEALDVARYCATLPPQQEISRITFIGSSISCQRYYICYYGQALLQECSANLHWNANIGKCDLPAKSGCTLQENVIESIGNNNGNNIANGNSNNNNNNENNNNGGNGSGGIITDLFINCPNYGQHIFPHMGRCDFFIYCVKGHATLQQCPFYFNFDIVSKSCKWRTAALCVRDLNINTKRNLLA